MLGPFLRGTRYPLRGLGWLPRRRLWIFVLTPLLINTVLFGGAVWWSSVQVDALASRLLEGLATWLPDWLDWLSTVLYWLIWPLFILAVLLVVFYTFTLVANFLGSPFNGLLAEQVEVIATGQAPVSPLSLWQEIRRAPVVELRKLGYLVAWAIPLLLLFLIPVVNLLAPFLWGVFGAWMLALQYVEYPLSNHGMDISEQRRHLRERRWLVLGFGTSTLVMTLIPVLNFLVMPAAVIGATLMVVEEFSPPPTTPGVP